MMGGALGLAVLASLAASRTERAGGRRRRGRCGADRRLPPRLPRRRGVRARGGGRRLHADPRGPAGNCACPRRAGSRAGGRIDLIQCVSGSFRWPRRNEPLALAYASASSEIQVSEEGGQCAAGGRMAQRLKAITGFGGGRDSDSRLVRAMRRAGVGTSAKRSLDGPAMEPASSGDRCGAEFSDGGDDDWPSLPPGAVFSSIVRRVRDLGGLAFEEFVPLFADQLLEREGRLDGTTVKLASAVAPGGLPVRVEALVLGRSR